AGEGVGKGEGESCGDPARVEAGGEARGKSYNQSPYSRLDARQPGRTPPCYPGLVAAASMRAGSGRTGFGRRGGLENGVSRFLAVGGRCCRSGGVTASGRL